MSYYSFLALPDWPYPSTPDHARRSRHTFKAGWDDTMRLLRREIEHLKGSNLAIGAGFREQDLRLDGLPRSGARAPEHPGVEISFNALAVEGNPRLVYATDVCRSWEHNVRSIALGLGSLRAVDRYGITRRGEQYAGWKQLASGADDEASVERGRALIREAGSEAEALKRTHPDLGGNPIDLRSVQMARGRT